MEIPHVTHPHEKIVYKLPELNDCIYVAQPFGKQCYAWFTNNGCIFSDRRTKRQWSSNVPFDPSICGTLLSVTMVYHEDTKCFLFDDFLYYKGEPVTISYLEKINLFVELMTHVQNTTVFFMLPCMSLTYTKFEPIYKMYSVKIVHSSMTLHFMDQKKINVFNVRSTPKSDIYELYTNTTLHSIAYIDTYDRSSYMNSIFHTSDLFIETDKKMECLWNDTFKKWIPIKII
jgi:hypothetical protein